MKLTAINYTAEALATKKTFDSLPKKAKSSAYWEKTDAEIVALKKEIKDFYLFIQDKSCVYCRQKIDVNHHGAWDTEHIVAKSTHPQFMFTPQNLCIACKDCNHEKGAKNVLRNPKRVRFPTKEDDYIIYHPHFDEFERHIRLLPHSLFFFPRTEKGVKTIEYCGLLRFLLSYVDYGVTDTQIKKEIALRHDLLQSASDPGEEMILVAELQELLGRLKQLSKAAGMHRILAKQAA